MRQPVRALIVVDVQQDYFPAGRAELPHMPQASQNVAALLAHFRKTQEPIFHIQHIEEGAEAPFFVAGSAGAEIHPSAAPQGAEPVIQKNAPNAFLGTSLHAQLQALGVNDLVVCGAMSNLCIDATTRAGADLGFACTVVEDACAAMDATFNGIDVSAQAVHAAFMANLDGIYARVVKTREWMSEGL